MILASAALSVPRAVRTVVEQAFTAIPCRATGDTDPLAAPCVTFSAEGPEFRHPQLAVLRLVQTTRWRPDTETPEEAAAWHAAAAAALLDRLSSLQAALAALGISCHALRPVDGGAEIAGEERQCQIATGWRMELRALI